jgi:hypothetical protein
MIRTHGKYFHRFALRRQKISPWVGYAPRFCHPTVLTLIRRLCNANKSDRCIVSLDKMRTLLREWFHLDRSRRWLCYHLKAAKRDLLLHGQTRWRYDKGQLTLKARTRYRIGFRHLHHLVGHARDCFKLLKLACESPGRGVVQKIALGLVDLSRSVVPLSP